MWFRYGLVNFIILYVLNLKALVPFVFFLISTFLTLASINASVFKSLQYNFIFAKVLSVNFLLAMTGPWLIHFGHQQLHSTFMHLLTN